MEIQPVSNVITNLCETQSVVHCNFHEIGFVLKKCIRNMLNGTLFDGNLWFTVCPATTA